jgi:peptidoglycan/LPS O-acetylase OafA/YrhL
MQRPLLHNVQVLRCLAACGVLITHAALLIPRDSRFWTVPWAAGVDLFFVISGFIMTWLTREQFGREGAAGRFLVRRAIRIVPAYWFFTSLMVLATIFAASHIRHTTVDPAQLVTSYGFIPWPRADGKLNPILSQGWTLNYEALFYLALAAALLFRRGLAWLVAGFVGLTLLGPLVPEDWFVLHFYADPIILDFVCGIGIALLALRGVRLPLAATILCVASAVGVHLAARHGLFPGSGRFLAAGLPSALIGAGLILAPEPQRIGLVGRALRLGGDASYTLYLSHTFTINVVLILWRKAGLEAPWANHLTGIVASLIVAILFYRFAERPAVDGLQRLLDMKPARGAQTIAP